MSEKLKNQEFVEVRNREEVKKHDAEDSFQAAVSTVSPCNTLGILPRNITFLGSRISFCLLLFFSRIHDAISGENMIETAYTMLRISLCRTFGWKIRDKDLHRLLNTALEDIRIFGEPSHASLTSLYTQEEMTYLQKRWLEKTIKHARKHVPFYKSRISQDIADNFDMEKFHQIPVTTKHDIRTFQPQFMSDDADNITLYASSSGTTGSPTEFYMSQRELNTWNLLQAITGVALGVFLPDDIIQYNMPLSAQPDTFSFAMHCNLVGCLAIMQGIVPPQEAVNSLVKTRVIKGKEVKVNTILSLPSYLIKVMNAARTLNYTENDFELDRIIYAGEVMPSQDKKEIAEFFGARMYAAYGSTEVFPVVANMCAHGNYHFDETGGYTELLAYYDRTPLTNDGDRGVLVITPYYPLRSAMPTIRYWTNDMAEKVVDCGCGISEHGGVYRILGRADYTIFTDRAAITQLDIMETAASVPSVARPVRVGIENLGRSYTISIKVKEKDTEEEIKRAFEELGLPVGKINLYTNNNFNHIPLRSENETRVRRGDRV